MKKFHFFIFIVLITFNLYSQEMNIEKILNGNWYRSPNPENTVTKEYSWGEGKTVINYTIEVDLSKDKKTIRLPMIGGPFDIVSIIPLSEDQIELTFFFKRGGFNVTYLIHIISEDQSWFELITDKNLTFIPTGIENMWYKIAGPNIKENEK